MPGYNNVMSRPLRIEYPGALYHLTARGNGKEAIFLDDSDRLRFLQMFGQEIEQQRWICYAWCLMDNHYHLLIETPEANLVSGMRRLNGRYTQSFNRRHGHVGHVFQGRYKSILVEKESYLLELTRYIVLNPVRARMVETPDACVWSSYRSMAGLEESPPWLASKLLIEHFGSEQSYISFVMDGMGSVAPWKQLHGQIWLGSQTFRELMQQRVPHHQIANIPRAHLQPSRPDADAVLQGVADYFGCGVDELLSRVHREGYVHAVWLLRRVANIPLSAVAEMFGISVARVSQVQKEVGESGKQPDELIGNHKL